MNVLNVISSPRGTDSYSIKLGDAIVEKLQAANSGSTVTVRDLATSPFPHLEEAKLKSLFTPAPDRTPEQQAAAKHSDDAIAEIQAADVIVIGGPALQLRHFLHA
ncbi:NAD(P)H-dependent oxidoreductase [Hymenobacter psychrophilus]|nr:NAD(P)H-dependent oxidoreductase [Hymenobacter psychrophilus]